MAHQIDFYILPEDTDALERSLRAIGSLVIVHSRSDQPTARVVPSTNVDENGHPWLYFYFARTEDLKLIKMRHVPAMGYWTVDVLRSPVIEFTRSFFDGSILRRGRAFYEDGFYDADDVWRDKGADFDRWAASILETIKRMLRKRGRDRLGEFALDWVLTSKGSLVD